MATGHFTGVVGRFLVENKHVRIRAGLPIRRLWGYRPSFSMQKLLLLDKQRRNESAKRECGTEPERSEQGPLVRATHDGPRLGLEFLYIVQRLAHTADNLSKIMVPGER